MSYRYKCSGTCSSEITFDVENNKLHNVSFMGGCNGNLSGICSLTEGMDIDDVLTKLKGIDCRGRGTSCPDQLARAIVKYKEEEKCRF